MNTMRELVAARRAWQVNPNDDDASMAFARALARRFGASHNDIEETLRVGVGCDDGWGWADVVLQRCHDDARPARAGENVYEFTAYGCIQDEWPMATAAVEAGERGAIGEVRRLLAAYRREIRQ